MHKQIWCLDLLFLLTTFYFYADSTNFLGLCQIIGSVLHLATCLVVLSLTVQVSVVPLMCPATTLDLRASGSNVSMCSCENVWLSALNTQRGSVTLDNLVCGSASTTAELLQEACAPPPSNREYELISTNEMNDVLGHDSVLVRFYSAGNNMG